MKSLTKLFLSLIVFGGSIAAVTLEDYAKGIVDADGDNLWHILAQGCDKAYFSEYVAFLAALSVTKDEEKVLAFLASERNNNNQRPIEIAARKWAPHEHKDCGYMIKLISDWEKEGNNGVRSKILSSSEMPIEENIVNAGN